jgi:hypothetical protein
MANIFTLDNTNDFTDRLNIDELYEKKRQHDLGKLEVFNKILNRIHVRIKTTSRQKLNEQFCWFVVPEVIIGVPKYDQGSCIAYLMDKLKENGFNIKYIHPNTFFISWMNWVPSYVRTELKKKTGIVVNEYGVRVEQDDDNEGIPSHNDLVLKPKESQPLGLIKQPKKDYTPIKSYKPTGNFVYDDDLLSKIEDKFT